MITGDGTFLNDVGREGQTMAALATVETVTIWVVVLGKAKSTAH